MANIPVVDFGKFLYGNAQEKEQAAKEIDLSFQRSGFVYLTNHGVPQDMVDECFEWSKKFFALPLDSKMLAPHPPGGQHHRGYSSPGLEKVSQHTYDEESISALREVPDYKESFESGNTTDSMQPNIWPPDEILPGFRAFMERFFTECKDAVHAVLDAMSIALGVPAPGLSPTHSQSLFQLRLLHYPALAESELQNNKRSRINAHSDFGTLTLLFQDSVGGLEIEDPSQEGKFIAAEPRKGTMLVNVADLMTRWSNDRWKSTVHRVGLPAAVSENGNGDAMLPDRYSIPFFAICNMGTVIEPLPGCWSEERPKKYEPTTAGEYLAMRMAALYE